MKLWPQKRWKKVLFVFSVFFLTVVVVLAIVGTYVSSAVNKDVVSGIEVVNPSGSKTALVVYQAGLTSFPKDTSYAFANGLAASGWRVEITTASSQAPSDLSKYSLLVLGFPTYGGNPGQVIVRYFGRVGDLRGINTVIIALGSVHPGEKRRYHEAESARRKRYGSEVACSVQLDYSARHGAKPGDRFSSRHRPTSWNADPYVVKDTSETIVCAVIKKRFLLLKFNLVIPLLQILVIALQVYQCSSEVYLS